MSNNSLTLSIGPELGLQRYLAEVRKFPMLAKDEEYMLARRWREHEDPGAAEKLVTSHLRLVAKMAIDADAIWIGDQLIEVTCR